MRMSTRMTLAAGWATGLSALPLGAVYDNWRWVWYTWAAIAAVVAGHLLARSLRMPAWLVPAVGLLGLLEYLVVVFAGGRAFLGVLPSGGALRALRDGVSNGFLDVHELSAPVPSNPGLVLITAGAVGLVAIVVDLVAVALRRPAAAGLPLLALYAVPTAVATNGVPWPLFVLGATGYLVLLMVEGRERLLRWGRPVAAGGAPDDAGEEAPVPLTGQRIGAMALAVAVILPLFVPGLTTNALSRLGRSGVGDGTGNGTGPLSPFAALKGQLDQLAPKELFRVKTPADEADLWYLRVKVLERYTPAGWGPEPGRAQQSVGGAVSPVTGQPEPPPPTDKTYTAQITMTGEFRDDALPTFFAPRLFSGLNDTWGYSADRAVVTASSIRHGSFTYQVEGAEPRPTFADLINSQPVSADDPMMRAYGRQPQVPELVRRVLNEAVAGKSTPYEKARALSDYFTEVTKGGFTYSLQTKQGDSGNALVDFLTKKQGYCEQYAAAMAVMLRLLGIPSRVVLGYTHHVRSSDNTWSVMTNDAHAWVEAYFSGIGWVPFDPTPLRDGRTVTLPYAPHPGIPTTEQTTVGGSSAVATGSGAHANGKLDPNDPNNLGGRGAQPGVFTPKIALGSIALLALIVLMLAPGVGRVLTRRRRLGGATRADPALAARAAWDEVLATAEDYGVAVPDAETPRRTASRLSRELDLEGPAAAGLRLAALAEERARYAPVAGVDGDLSTAVRAVRRGVRATVTRGRRWRSTLLPASTLRAARAGAAIRMENASTSVSRLDDRLRRALVPRRLAARRAGRQG